MTAAARAAPPVPAIDMPEALLSPRLRLRRVTRDDLPDLLAVNGDDEVTRFLPYATWQSSVDGESWFQRMMALTTSTGGVQMVLQSLATGRVIGTCLLFRHESVSLRAEVGYVLGRAHWGQGYMSEALRALLDHALGAGGLRRIEAEIDSHNDASNAVARRLGFALEGRLRQRWTGKGRTYDTLLYGLLRDDWTGATRGRPD